MEEEERGRDVEGGGQGYKYGEGEVERIGGIEKGGKEREWGWRC